MLDAEVTRDDRVLLQLLLDTPEGLEADRDAALTDGLERPPASGWPIRTGFARTNAVWWAEPLPSPSFQS